MCEEPWLDSEINKNLWNTCRSTPMCKKQTTGEKSEFLEFGAIKDEPESNDIGELQQLVSLLQKKHDVDEVVNKSLLSPVSIPGEVVKRARKEHAMSHFPDEKRGPPYQWDYRAPLPFCPPPPQSWPPMPLSLSHSNHFFPAPHLIPPHLSQWATPNKLPHAHTQSKLPLSDPMKDLTQLGNDPQQETVDLSARSQVPVQLTVEREISSTEDVSGKKVEEETKSPSPKPEPLQAGEQPPTPATAALTSPEPIPPAPAEPDRPEVTQSEGSPSPPPEASTESNCQPQPSPSEAPPPVAEVSSVEVPESAAASSTPAESLPTVSSTSADVKIPPKDNRKKKKPTKKRVHDSRNKSVVKRVKLEKQPRRVPVLHVTGSREKPLTVQVINGPRAEEDSRTHQPDLRVARPRNGLFSSTLSARYDAHTSDPTWICVFCKKGPHYRGLGDLFGPYFVSREENEDLCDFSGDERDIVETQKRGSRHKKSIRANQLEDHFRNMSRRLKRAKSCDSSATMAGLTPVGDDSSDEQRFEVWTHELCVVWSPGVCLLDTRLLGLQEAVWHCHKAMCSKCGLMGANLGCIHRNCPNQSHYLCALDSGWHLPQDSFISTCQFHVQR